MDKDKLYDKTMLYSDLMHSQEKCEYIESRIEIAASGELSIKQFLLLLSEDLMKERTKWVELTKKCYMEICKKPKFDSGYKELDNYLNELNEKYKELLKD